MRVYIGANQAQNKQNRKKDTKYNKCLFYINLFAHSYWGIVFAKNFSAAHTHHLERLGPVVIFLGKFFSSNFFIQKLFEQFKPI